MMNRFINIDSLALFLILGFLCIHFQGLHGFVLPAPSPHITQHDPTRQRYHHHHHNARTHPTITYPSSSSSSTTSSSASSSSALHMDGKGMAGSTFNKHLLGDVLRALQPRYLSQLSQSISGNVKGPMTNIQLSPLLEYDNHNDESTTNKNEYKHHVPTWTQLQHEWTQQSKSQTSAASFRDKLNNGLVHSALANRRVFDTTNNANYQITFYKDAASWCPYCQKVWIALEELELNYDIVPVDMNWYV